MSSDPKDHLVSWKEISAHLGIDERTCQRWEKKYGLPVRRIDPATKSRVFAYKTELDDWQERMSGGTGSIGKDIPATRPAIPIKRSAKAAWTRAAGILMVLGCVLTFILARPFGVRTPADFRIEGSALIITDKAGRELWRHDTGLENLLDEKAYRLRFQKDVRITENERTSTLEPFLIIKDFDRDGRTGQWSSRPAMSNPW
jgi:hypothetical protein